MDKPQGDGRRPAKPHLPPPGLHAVLICAGLFVTLLLFYFVPWLKDLYGGAFYAGIATIICLKPDLKSSHQMGVRRIAGTFVGGAVGMGAMVLFAVIGAAWEPFLIPVFALAILWLCRVIGIRESAQIGCIVLLSVLIMHKPEGMAAYHYVLCRIVETVVGVLVAVLVNLAAAGIGKLTVHRRSSLDGRENQQEEQD